MRKIGDKAKGSVIQRLHCLRLSALLTGTTRISNRKSGIRIPRKPRRISTLQIPNRKYSQLLHSPQRIAIFDRSFCRSSRFLIHGSAIKTPRNTSKKNTYEFLIGGKPGGKGSPVARPKTAGSHDDAFLVAGGHSSLVARHLPLPSGILLGLCWTWDMCESIWM